METTTLFIKSNGLTGNELFDFVRLKLLTHRDNNLDEFDEIFPSHKVELVIDGEDWMFTHNSKQELVGMCKITL